MFRSGFTLGIIGNGIRNTERNPGRNPAGYAKRNSRRVEHRPQVAEIPRVPGWGHIGLDKPGDFWHNDLNRIASPWFGPRARRFWLRALTLFGPQVAEDLSPNPGPEQLLPDHLPPPNV